jgi:glycosyltransferase involved in cell wall biosynthesis
LLAAMVRLADRGTPARLTIVGDGPLRASLEMDSAPLGERVRFLGAIPPADVTELLRKATVVAVPSTNDEGLSLVALEAMAQGALVVATAAGGLEETVRDRENAIVVPAHDDLALADALAHLIEIAGTAAGDRLRRGGRATALEHDLDRVTQASVRHYRDLPA